MTQANAINAGSTGFQSFNGTGTFAGRTLQQGSGITITNANGVSGDPTISATGSSPNTNIMLSDDFTGMNVPSGAAAGFNSQLAWYANVGTTGFNVATAFSSGHPGVLFNVTNLSHHIFLEGQGTSQVPQWLLGGGTLVVNWVFILNPLSDVTNRYILRLGLGDTVGSDQVNGCYFEYSDNINSGNWVLKTASASSRTTTNTAVAVTANVWHNAQITVNAAASSVNFTMDGVSLGNITTNIPTAGVSPFMDFIQSSGTVATATLQIDLFYLSQTLTTPR